jgi:hypothetical protein
MLVARILRAQRGVDVAWSSVVFGAKGCTTLDVHVGRDVTFGG